MSRRLLLIFLALATLGLTACGGKEETVTRGESEAFYVTLGSMQYQVQLSRQLNPFETGDRALLAGIAPREQGLGDEDVWFGVWIRVFNQSAEPARAADQWKIVDTKGAEYEPIALNPVNPFAYRSQSVDAGNQYPVDGSPPRDTPATGGLLLFKLPRQALDFRPLELEFSSSVLPGKASSVTLDV